MRFYNYLMEQDEEEGVLVKAIKSAGKNVANDVVDLTATFLGGDFGKDITDSIKQDLKADPNFKSTEKSDNFSKIAKQLWASKYEKVFSETFKKFSNDYIKTKSQQSLYNAAFTRIVMEVFEADGDILRYYYHKDLLLSYLRNNQGLKLSTPYNNFSAAGILDSEEINAYIKKYGIKTIVDGYLNYILKIINDGNVEKVINNMDYKPNVKKFKEIQDMIKSKVEDENTENKEDV